MSSVEIEIKHNNFIYIMCFMGLLGSYFSCICGEFIFLLLHISLCIIITMLHSRLASLVFFFLMAVDKCAHILHILHILGKFIFF